MVTVDQVRFDLDVGGVKVPAVAIRQHRNWILTAMAYPEVQVADLDLGRGKRILAKRLLLKVRRAR